MTRPELIEYLKSLKGSGDAEGAHADADRALLDYIHDATITRHYNAVPKWYA